jgi:hypothetical protein
VSAWEKVEVADMHSLLLWRGKPRAYLFSGHELMGLESLMRGKDG